MGWGGEVLCDTSPVALCGGMRCSWSEVGVGWGVGVGVGRGVGVGKGHGMKVGWWAVGCGSVGESFL